MSNKFNTQITLRLFNNAVVVQRMKNRCNTFTILTKNEKFVKIFMEKLVLKMDNGNLILVWNAREIQLLFPIKNKVSHLSCVI